MTAAEEDRWPMWDTDVFLESDQDADFGLNMGRVWVVTAELVELPED